MKNVFRILVEPTGVTYRNLIKYSLRCCKFALFVVRDSMGLNSSAMDFLEEMEPYLVSKKREYEWPGTQLLDHTALVCKYNLTYESAEIIINGVDHLFAWQQPEMPEDLCLLRPNGSPWLISIAHEGDAYLELTDAERQQIEQDLPDLKIGEDLES